MERIKIVLNAGEILEGNYIGLGVEWDPSDTFDYTPEQWQLFIDRITFLRPALIRCMTGSSCYCTGVRGDQISYDWERRKMGRLYKLLDVCQARGIKVIYGEWWSPGRFADPESDRVEMDDPRWSRMLTDTLDELINRRGYTCISFFNCVNEPNNPGRPNVSDPFTGVWGTAIKNLRAEMDARGFSYIPIIGPDTYDDWENWLDYCLPNLADQLGEYDVHWYASREDIETGNVAVRMGALRERLKKDAPGKRFFFGEMGSITGKNLPGDQQMELPKYWYGVAMADMLAQSINAGIGRGCGLVL